MVETYGFDNIGMYTFTFAEDVTPEEAQRRWHSFNVNVLSKRYPGGHWVKVLELTKRGRPHYHWIGVVQGIRKGVKIETVSRPDGRARLKAVTTSPECVLSQERAFLHERLVSYGFGSWNDISPILSTAEAAAEYASKYVTKGFEHRPASLKGVRLVGFGGGAKPGTTRFTSIGGRASDFRLGLSILAEENGLKWEDLPEFCEILYSHRGPKFKPSRWAYYLREDIDRCLQEFKAAQPF